MEIENVNKCLSETKDELQLIIEFLKYTEENGDSFESELLNENDTIKSKNKKYSIDIPNNGDQNKPLLSISNNFKNEQHHKQTNTCKKPSAKKDLIKIKNSKKLKKIISDSRSKIFNKKNSAKTEDGINRKESTPISNENNANKIKGDSLNKKEIKRPNVNDRKTDSSKIDNKEKSNVSKNTPSNAKKNLANKRINVQRKNNISKHSPIKGKPKVNNTIGIRKKRLKSNPEGKRAISRPIIEDSSSEDEAINNDIFSNLTDIITDDEDENDRSKENSSTNKKANSQDNAKTLKCNEMEFFSDSPTKSEKSLKHEDPLLQCESCSYTTKLKRRFEAHLQTHKYKSYRCEQCNERFVLEDSYHQHMERHNKSFSCDICDKQFAKEISLINHKEKKHLEPISETLPEEPEEKASELPTPVLPTPIKFRKCPYCDFWTVNAVHLENHLTSHIEKPLGNEMDTSDPDKTGQFENGISENQKQVLRSQTETTSNKKELPTIIRLFGNQAPASEDEKQLMIKNDEPPINNEASPMDKGPTDDSAVKPFQCPNCNKAFLNSFSLKRHSFLHTGKKTLRCTICKYKCLSSSNLSIHLRTHSGKRPFKCPKNKCKCSFKKLSSLKKHLRKHPTTLSQCPSCAFSSAYLKLFLQHQKISHPSPSASLG